MIGTVKVGSKVKTKERNKAYSGELMTVTEVYEKNVNACFISSLGLIHTQWKKL